MLATGTRDGPVVSVGMVRQPFGWVKPIEQQKKKGHGNNQMDGLRSQSAAYMNPQQEERGLTLSG